MPTISILGPGAVGGFLATLLAGAGHDVTVIAREPEAAAITRDGISLESVTLGRRHARPTASTALTEPVDVLLVTTKATTLVDALARIRVAPTLVVPLLNGLEHVATLRARFPRSTVAAGTIRMESDCPAPGRVVHSSPAVRIELASDEPSAQDELRELAQILESAGVATRIGPGEAQILWSKLVRLNALASTTSAANAPIGTIREHPRWRATLIACVEETAAAANADGAQIDPAASLAELDATHPGQRSSMQRDIAAGREPELDAITGAVIRAAARHGLDCPTLTRLAGEIAARARIAAPSPAVRAASSAR